jgi:hypothetical protein
MIGRSMPSAWTTTRVATRLAFGVGEGSADPDGATSIGGRDGRVRLEPGSAATIVGSAEASGSAAAALPV